MGADQIFAAALVAAGIVIISSGMKRPGADLGTSALTVYAFSDNRDE